MWRVELTKLAAQLRVQVVILGCLLGPVVFVVGLRVANAIPGDTVFGLWVHESGFADSLVILNWAGLWALPLSISVVAGDICSEEHRLGTWSLLLTRSRSRSQILAGKMLAAATYSVTITVLVGLASTVVGLLVVGHQPLVGLSGSLLSPHAALQATAASWLTELAPVLAITGIALLSSVLSRNSWVGVLVPVVLVGCLNMGSLVSAIDPIRPLLPTTGLEAWHGLVRQDVYTNQIWISVIVSAGVDRALLRSGGGDLPAQGRGRQVRKILALVLAGAVSLLLAGCGPDITQARVQGAIGPTFANLYVLQRSLLGLAPAVDPTASAVCGRTGRGVPNSGAGDDWICQLSLSVDGQFQSTFTYELSIRADGCYVADGSPSVVGGAMLTTPSGAFRVNPLFEFYGCFDT